MSFFYQKKQSYFNEVIFFASIAIGVGISCFLNQKMMLQSGYLYANGLERLCYLQIEENKFLLCVLQCRIQLVILILILTLLIPWKILKGFLLNWFGITCGILMFLFYYQFGTKGEGLFLVCLFPHILFYGLALSTFFQWKDLKEGTFFCSMEQSKKHHSRLLFGKGILVTIIGIITESYVNPIIVSKFVIFLKIL